jgi:diguanylate cyclase (GGDEF)-like protein
MDTVPRSLDAEQIEALAALSRALVAQLELRRLLAISRREALIDPLTGLGNRRQLMVDFAELLPAATSAEPLHLLLLDLDGFKSYNDAFGHTAGDGLLARLAGKLQLALADAHGVYRLGGDEFCALTHGDPVRLEAGRTAAHHALTEHGLGFSITASVGSASVPAEAGSTTEALQLADERMYLDKPSTSRVASHQTTDVLMSILNERDPTLRDHGLAVAQIAIAVGARLGMSGEALSKLATAAELHDIGKMAVPDEILNKPGPLNPDEWEFMKTHTVLGERILAAAPALSGEAALIRSSHERWDGAGYPDGLFWTDIPLGSRIIFVVDAFDAMISVRAYKDARTDADALTELHRCAGTQFDPSVVAALDDVVRASSDESVATEAAPHGTRAPAPRRRFRAGE